MKKLFLLSLLILFTITFKVPATTLSAGDIAIVGFNSDDPDEFAFVCLKDIDAGTVIIFTDCGWSSGSLSGFTTSNADGGLTWTAPASYSAGEVVYFSGTGSGGWTTYDMGTGGSFALATTGDEILAFQGTSASPTFIYAIYFNGTSWPTNTNSNSAAGSDLPPSLINTISAVAVGKVHNGYYNGGAMSDLSALRTSIGNSVYWVTGSSRFDLQGQLGSSLPVELTSFSAMIKESAVNLSWVTETEVNSYGFEVQRSVETDKWEVLGFVEGAGNSNSPKEYSYTDDKVNPANAYKYRLRMIDNDGSYEYSKIIEVNFSIPTTTDLMQNYPNPFNPTTTISFTLPESGNVTLKIFNPLGEEIATLVNGYTEAGVHVFNFNAGNLPSGMYIYQLKTNSNTLTKKMLFLK